VGAGPPGKEAFAGWRTFRLDLGPLTTKQWVHSVDAMSEARTMLAPEEAPPAPFIHPLALVELGAAIGDGCQIWPFAHVMRGAVIGQRCVLGQNVHVAAGVVIGNNVKIQNNVSVYAGTRIEDDVFLGPSAVLTNVTNPRAEVSRRALYEPTLIRRGATVGANATITSGVTLGRYAFVGAGAVVTRDVPDYALVMGNPARQRGWMSRHGQRLQAGPDGTLVCPESGLGYRERAPGVLGCVDLDEEAPLPERQRVARKTYDEYKQR
jgi:UDP-2-acetamido-3-amino-2,3-dideoxy-glucuronate N-acetyltransferase